jgi:hypothetical protein
VDHPNAVILKMMPLARASTMWLFLLLVGTLLLAGCAAGPNATANTPDVDGTVAGFWRGLWHGLICPFTFVISLFADAVHIYEVHNNGGWYNFGFLLGVATIFGGGSSRVSDG